MLYLKRTAAYGACCEGAAEALSGGTHPVREARLSLSRIWVKKVLDPLKINYRQREFELKVL